MHDAHLTLTTPPVRPARQRPTWLQNLRTRRALARLDAERLRDVGLTPHQARQEARKWPWCP